MSEVADIFLGSVRDGFVQVSAFVAVTVLLFSYVQYRTDGRLVKKLEENRRAGPLVGALMGLTPGCGGAIVMMPLYVRGSVSFGTVVATLIATAGDAAFVILALAPEAALYSYGIAFATAILFGYAVDNFGLGVGRVDRAVRSLSTMATDGGVAAPVTGNKVHHYDDAAAGDVEGACDAERFGHDHDGPVRDSPLMRSVSLAALVAWWAAAAVGLGAGVLYLLRGAPDVPMVAGLSFAGLFTVAGIAGTTLSVYLYFVGRKYVGHGDVGRARDTFGSTYETLTHAAMETSFVTVWVIAAYLLYEYAMLFTGADIAGLAAAAGVLAPVAGAAVGLIPGCGPQIILSTAYAEGAIPFSALTANAISQDGDALFPLIAIDKTAAVVASIYTTVPALVVGVVLHYTWTAVFGLPQFGFGVL
ncbi:putative manganese transporter [Halogeometricum luteum]|uniref:Manganese transporter n=1 Tax=Halogeometricum luteum TaxID=2950537 RepID=A0ABU2FXC5_9EURY|nr:putative manganese transporter [Halogeometricum sp. S3BR5-2]MDS0293189.1 putative manganese transporter [Halogeometricum sp. S3BR5-2]